MPEVDWRTDNWGGHRPTWYRHNDPNMSFARSTKELGWGWYRSLDALPEEHPSASWLDYKVSVGTVISFFLAIFAIGIWFPEMRDVVNSLGDILNMWWHGWDTMPITLK